MKVTVLNQGTVAAGPFWLDWYANRDTAPVVGLEGQDYARIMSLIAG